MVLYPENNRKALLENWTATSLYCGNRLAEGISIRIVNEIYDLMSIKTSWNCLVEEACAGMTFEQLSDYWRSCKAGKQRMLHMLLIYSSRSLIGGALYDIRSDSILGIVSHRRLEPLISGADESNIDRQKFSGQISMRRSIISAKGSEMCVAQTLAEYFSDNSSYWDELNFGEDPLELIVVDLLVSRLQEQYALPNVIAGDRRKNLKPGTRRSGFWTGGSDAGSTVERGQSPNADATAARLRTARREMNARDQVTQFFAARLTMDARSRRVDKQPPLPARIISSFTRAAFGRLTVILHAILSSMRIPELTFAFHRQKKVVGVDG